MSYIWNYLWKIRIEQYRKFNLNFYDTLVEPIWVKTYLAKIANIKDAYRSFDAYIL